MTNPPLPAPGGGPGAAVPPTSEPVKVSAAEIDQFTLRQIGKHGTLDNAFRVIAGEQIQNRKKRQRAERVAESLKGKLPKEGELVLNAEEAAAYKALKTADAGFSLAKVGDQLKELGTLRSTSAKQTRATAVNTAAGTKYKVDVLKQLLGDVGESIGLPIEFEKMLKSKDDGEGVEEVQIPYVRVGDTKELMETWLERVHKNFLPVLLRSDDDADTSETPAARPAASMPRQIPGATTPPKKGADKDILAAVDAQMNARYQFGQKEAVKK